MSKHGRSAKRLIISEDDDVTEGEELNPFSFKEFIRSKNYNTEVNSSSSQRTFDPVDLTFDPEDRTGLFLDSSHQHQEEEEEEEQDEVWAGSYQPLSVELDYSIEEEQSTRFSSEVPDKTADRVAERGAERGPEREPESYEGDDETSIAEPLTFHRISRSNQLLQLKQENVVLRRTVRDLQRKCDQSDLRVSQLSEELQQRKRVEEKEAEDLENMIHSVEKNLHLMTQRAVKAETNVSKLKLEIQHLQRQCDLYREESERLEAVGSEVILSMRHNAKMAAEQLSKSVGHAHISLRQLLKEAESLSLVSQLLQSIDKISHQPQES